VTPPFPIGIPSRFGLGKGQPTSVVVCAARYGESVAQCGGERAVSGKLLGYLMAKKETVPPHCGRVH
jgi:hypothetical protein